MVSIDFPAGNPERGTLELDWNDEFIVMLRKSGFTGKTDDDVVNMWLGAICYNISQEIIAENPKGSQMITRKPGPFGTEFS